MLLHTYLHAPSADVLDAVPIVNKCHAEWGPIQRTKRPFQGWYIARILFGRLKQLAYAIEASEHPALCPTFATACRCCNVNMSSVTLRVDRGLEIVGKQAQTKISFTSPFCKNHGMVGRAFREA